MRKAVFLDKDGTLLHDVPHNVDPAHVSFTFGAQESVRRLNDAGWCVVVVTNQPGVAAGIISEAQLNGVKHHLHRELATQGARLDAIYACTHGRPAPGARPSCPCRKPNPGMLLQAAEDMGIDLDQSWMIGDILDDVEAGNLAGCRSILFCNGGETLWEISPARVPDHVVFSLPEAASLILGHD